MADHCPGCQYRFEREEGFFLGAYVVNFAVTEITLIVFIASAFVVTLPDPPELLLALIGVGISIIVPIAFYPFSKTIWTAIDLLMHRSTPE